MSKILLTGHTSPIGKHLKSFLEKTHEIIPVSRSSGYDLTNPEDYKRVIDLSLTCDCVINLAYLKIVQVNLLYDLYQAWVDNKKYGKIISVGTLGTAATFNLHNQIGTEFELIANKLALEKMHNELSLSNPFGAQPQSILIRFAAYGDRGPTIPGLKPEQIIEVFNFALESKSYVSTLDFREIHR